jgi:hypothetical protein
MSPISARRLRQPFIWLIIVQQFLAGAGVPMPCPAVAAGSAERYPCEHCGCGCASAEQCWLHCSCFTFEQKVAWARRNGVAVPEYALAAAKRQAAAPRNPTCPQSGCAHHHHCRSGLPAAAPSRGVSWLNALYCRGLTQQWQAVTESWPGDRHVEFCVALLPRGCVESQPFPRYLFSPLPPPTPPPNEA